MRIIGTGSALPERVVTNGELSGFLDTSDEWIKSRTGIAQRRVLTTESLLSLARKAAEAALNMADCAASQIDYIIFSTVLGDWITPGMGCALAGELQMRCPAVDINGACAGFISALDLADALHKSGKAKRTLIVCAEAMSRMADWRDRSCCVLFGDGAAAAVTDGGEGLIGLRLGVKDDASAIHMRAPRGNSPFAKEEEPEDYLHMRGQEVYRFAVSASFEDLTALIAGAGLAPQDIDGYLLHQANLRILDAVRGRLKLDAARFPSNIDRTGNTSSASVAILLDELNRAGRLKAGEIYALSAFGAGLVSGACLLRWGQ